VEALSANGGHKAGRCLVNFIARAEAGTKDEHIRFASDGRYAPERCSLIGGRAGRPEGGPG